MPPRERLPVPQVAPDDVDAALADALFAERERAAFLSETSRALAGSLNLRRTVGRTLHLAVPQLADGALVGLVDGPVLTCSSWDGEGALTEDVPVGLSAAPAPVTEVLTTGLPREVPAAEVAALPLLVLQRGASSGLADVRALVLPLAARGSVFGVAVLVRRRRPTAFEDADTALASDFAQRAAFVLDAARLYAERAHVARVLQSGLLPPSLPDVPGVRLAARYRAGQESSGLGGDFYDVHGEGDDWTVVIGDVCGKGVEAAVLTGLARQSARTAALTDRSPGRVLALLDAVLATEEDNRFATMVCARLRPGPEGAVRLDVAVAGHPRPLVARAGGGLETLDAEGLPVGVLPPGVRPPGADPEAPAYPETSTLLHPGDVLLLYTDGVTEARGAGGLLGAEGLERLVADAAPAGGEVLVETVEQATLQYVAGGHHDDVALLAVEATGRTGPGPAGAAPGSAEEDG